MLGTGRPAEPRGPGLGCLSLWTRSSRKVAEVVAERQAVSKCSDSDKQVRRVGRLSAAAVRVQTWGLQGALSFLAHGGVPDGEKG